jgi:competence protein ComFC
VLPKLTKLKGMALDLLFPRWCVGCGGEGSFLCQSCQRSLPRIEPPFCPRCGKPQTGGQLCSGCVEWQASIDGIRSPFRFEGAVREAVHQLKYRNLRTLAPLLAGLLNDCLTATPLPAEVLVPVPLHRKRLRERGYNQSRLLVEGLSRLNDLPAVVDCLVRQKHTPPQTRTSTVEERRDNVIGVFASRDDRLRGKKVLLIDDVATSGATLDACAAVLKESGAASVWALTLAREV